MFINKTVQFKLQQLNKNLTRLGEESREEQLKHPKRWKRILEEQTKISQDPHVCKNMLG
jgi:hypothetical protein